MNVYGFVGNGVIYKLDPRGLFSYKIDTTPKQKDSDTYAMGVGLRPNNIRFWTETCTDSAGNSGYQVIGPDVTVNIYYDSAYIDRVSELIGHELIHVSIYEGMLEQLARVYETYESWCICRKECASAVELYLNTTASLLNAEADKSHAEFHLREYQTLYPHAKAAEKAARKIELLIPKITEERAMQNDAWGYVSTSCFD